MRGWGVKYCVPNGTPIPAVFGFLLCIGGRRVSMGIRGLKNDVERESKEILAVTNFEVD